MRRLAVILALVALFAIPGISVGSISGSTACPTSGAKQVRSTPASAFSYTIQAPVGNTGTINIGGPTITTSTGIQLQPAGTLHEGTSGSIYNLSSVYFACSVNTDTITWKYE